MNHAKRRMPPPPAQPWAREALVAPGWRLRFDLGDWRLTVRAVPSTARAADAATWNGPGLLARRLARRH